MVMKNECEECMFVYSILLYMFKKESECNDLTIYTFLNKFTVLGVDYQNC